MDLAGFAAPWIIYLAVLLLHLILPARRVTGYVRDAVSGEPLVYRINGVLVMGVIVTLWALCGTQGWLPFNWLWQHRLGSFAGAFCLGILFTLVMVLPAEPAEGSTSILADLYLGRRLNPQLLGGRLDIKMALYLLGAVMLELNLLSFLAQHIFLFGAEASAGLLLYTAMLSWFVCDYLLFEHVHLYTYDLFAERVGFKLGWGCLLFYPYFYVIGLWDTADLPAQQAPLLPPNVLLVIAALCFFIGWTLARGANMQKYFYKRDPARSFLGIVPETLSDGQHTLLCNGFWGVSRHVNYLGEVMMAVGLTLSLGHPTRLLPWLYPLYYVLLLVPRERADHRRCAAKYGPLWEQYCKRVRYRIIPGLY